MKIRKNAWHYWFYTFMMDFPPKTTNLCRYFWRTVLGMALTAFFATFISIAVAFILGGAYLHPFGALAVVGILACVGGLFYLGYQLDNKWQHRTLKEPGLIRSYLAARKAKVCPIITFESEDE